MTQTRREFLGLGESNPKLITNISPYANKELPKFGSRSALGLNPEAGNLTKAKALHLLRRTMISPSKADVDYATGKLISTMVDELLNPSPSALNPAPPVRFYATELDTNKTPSRDVAYEATWVNTRIYPDQTIPNDNVLVANINNQRRGGLKAWWTGQMLNQDRSILEKMTLFWHNHFATESDTVQDPHLLYNHYALLRTNALGNFKSFVKDITIDLSMLFYLNNRLNSKTAPDENYARELQELFTLGRNSGYTEDDVKAAAKVLTGHSINYTTILYEFKSNTHETGDKQFSSFYNNTKITGKSGAAGAGELDELLDMIFAKSDVVAQFIVRKLYRYFVYYTIDTTTEQNVIVPLANIFKTNWDIKPVLKKLLESEHFFDMLSQGCNIKNPIDYVIAPFRLFNAQFSAVPTTEQKYILWNMLRTQMANMQMDPGDPPNVAGWQAYYQEPQYYEWWINSDTYPKRMSFIDTFITSSFKYNSVSLGPDFPNWVKDNISIPSDPNVLISELSQLIYGLDLSQATKDNYKTTYLLSGQVTDSYWTTAWNNWLGAPTNSAYKTEMYNNRLFKLIQQMLKLEEFNLS